ncbi:MAG: hypothetical protein WCP09_00280 [Candidatus Taylorbacteria bacterium]
MKIKIFASTALATSLLVEAVELVVNRKVRFGEHEVNLKSANEADEKTINFDGKMAFQTGSQGEFDVYGTVILSPAPDGTYGGKANIIFSVTCVKECLHQFEWDSQTNELKQK